MVVAPKLSLTDLQAKCKQIRRDIITSTTTAGSGHPTSGMSAADLMAVLVDGYLRLETAPGNLELATYVHPAGHEVPDAVPALIVSFFKRHTLSGG